MNDLARCVGCSGTAELRSFASLEDDGVRKRVPRTAQRANYLAMSSAILNGAPRIQGLLPARVELASGRGFVVPQLVATSPRGSLASSRNELRHYQPRREPSLTAALQ